ncbi:hypothetical protein DM02DRAFT_696995 [Periconia macrospinosa]|uniref:Fumarylacetoacetase-like C-terminal domain-containing protein n=1 Tax=Periconia macrospinosa TaxID=97972 RepID=A0A2V1DZK3_9PLEO|nr:hypothetical protein DM02DRAFT_696995 [Periconia macrospinosa]
MAPFSRLVRFESEDEKSYFADLGPGSDEPPRPGTTIEAFPSYEALVTKSSLKTVTVQRLTVPSYPPLWTKPAAALAHPNQEISVNDFCARSLPDYEGELVFVTSKECKDVKPSEAGDYILGYTVGNDLSCRIFQLPKNSAGQFFFAKAFDNFAPIGPILISPSLYETAKTGGVTLKVNGEVRQEANLQKDMIFSPESILSHMSQGTTIPAGTAVMTGTPRGVGAFRKPKTFLQNGDVVEVSLPMAGTLTNTMKFE